MSVDINAAEPRAGPEPERSGERRAHPRSTISLHASFRSTRSFPRGERGAARVSDVSAGGAGIRVGRPLEIGQWIKLSWKPSLRELNLMPASLRAATSLRARVVRVDPVEGSYGVAFPSSPRLALLAAFDRILPWLGVALLVLTAANVLWLRADNVYYFWYHPVLNLYGLLISGYILSRIVLACVYRPPADSGYLPSVTVAISCKNEEASIVRTLDCVFRSDYPEHLLDVIVVDDGSTDGTWAEIERARSLHPRLQTVRFESNRGKRHGMAAAALRATGEVVVYVDSDSFVRRDAVRRIVQGLADPEVGAVCGHAKVENASENFLTRMQEVRYYVAFRIVKSAESLFSTVTCCSGCLAAYRRSYLMSFLQVWLGQRFLGVPATFGDDRSLTNFMLRRFRVIYDSEAVCSTIVPSTLRQFFRQQLRWKKSWIRESLLASTFMWKRHPLAAFYFYLGVVFPLVSPAVVFVAIVLPLVGLGAFSYLYIYGTFLMALVYGLVYLVRHKTAMWFYGLAFSLFYMVVLVWQTYYALATLRRNHWGTR
ncbi:MAG TPA: glycosyltransferase [Candidatus Polarisedimenticolaceae bacterium]|nr:glycosyltransferase [Candidatus Polarisedimenticolaceae bacterium]